MPDHLSREDRSRNMSRIRGKDTSIEVKVRKYLYHHGYRYRKNVKELPGTPDIYISKYNTVIFINGCFWHHHYNCRLATIPSTNTEYWVKKFNTNISNDIKHTRELIQLGYKVITLWECEINDCFDYRMEKLEEEIKEKV